MAKIPRKTQLIFGDAAGGTGITEFGSPASGTPVYSTDLDNIQTADWGNGWSAAALAGSAIPTFQDFNAIHYVTTNQLGYVLQEGIAEYDSGTEYHANSIVKKTGTYELYGSAINNNTGNALPSAVSDANWDYLGDLGNSSIVKVSTNDTTPNFLENKVDTDNGGVWFVENDGGDESLLYNAPGKNYIINGDFRLWRRIDAGGVGTTLTTSDFGRVYHADRFFTQAAGSLSRDSVRISGLVHQYGMRLVANVNSTNWQLGTVIPNDDSLVNKTITVTAKVLVSSTATNARVRILDGDSGAGSGGIQEQSFTPTGSLQTVSFTATMGTHIDSLEGWYCTVIADLDATEVIELHEIQVEDGTASTDFEYVDDATLLRRCEYFGFSVTDTVLFGARKVNASSFGAVTTSTFSTSIGFPVMRDVPTITGVTASNITLNGESGSVITTCTAIPLVVGNGTGVLSMTFSSADVSDATQIRFASGELPFFDAEI